MRRDMTRRAGQAMGLVVAGAIIIAIIGVAIIFLIQWMGGGKELQNLVDSGNLNVAKMAPAKIGVALKPGDETDHFSVFLNSDNLLTLKGYNRAIGMALMIGMRANEINANPNHQYPGTYENAKKLFAVLQGNQDTIGGRLAAEIQNSSKLGDYFSDLAKGDSIRLLGKQPFSYVAHSSEQSSSDVGYATDYGNGCADVYFVDSLPDHPIPDYIHTSTIDNKKYLKADEAMTVPNVGTLQAVITNPGQGAHVIPPQAFKSSFSTDGMTQIGKGIPPNSFKSMAVVTAEAAERQANVSMESVAVVGSPGENHPAGIVGGYITIINPQGLIHDGAVKENFTSIFDHELVSPGIFVSNNKCFSLDQALLKQWIDYTAAKAAYDAAVAAKEKYDAAVKAAKPGDTLPAAPAAIPALPVRPSSSTGIFNSAGSQASDADIMGITAWANNTKDTPFACVNQTLDCATCKGLVKSFLAAYPDGAQSTKTFPDQMLAVEWSKISIFDAGGTLGAQYAGNAGAPGGSIVVYPPQSTVSGYAGFTGLRHFDPSIMYIYQAAGTSPPTPLPGTSFPPLPPGAQIVNSPIFSTPGTLREYFLQVGSGSYGTAYAKFHRALLYMKPTITAAEINWLLDNVRMDLDTVRYIKLNPDTDKFRIERGPAAHNIQTSRVDGPVGQYYSATYPLFINIANAYTDGITHYQIFFNWGPIPDTPELYGQDSVIVRENSGYGGLLLELEFHNFVGGAETCWSLN